MLTIDLDKYLCDFFRHGETFERGRHEQGTEVKAITYSAMQIYEGNHQKKEGCHVYVIVDI